MNLSSTIRNPKWLIGSIITLILIVIAAITFANSDGSVTASIKEVFLSFLRGRGPVERILISLVFVGVGNALLIPINILLFITALLLPPWEAFAAGIWGAVLAALLGYLYGFFIEKGIDKKKLGKKYEVITHEISENAFKAVVLLCFAPIAPNTVTNVMAGMCRIPIWKLIAGTLVGFIPGVAIITLLGRQMRQMFQEPGYQAVIWIVAILALFVVAYKMGKRVQKRIEERAEAA